MLKHRLFVCRMLGAGWLLLALAAAPASAAETVRIGVCLPLTGEFAESGKKTLAGVRIRADEFNAEQKGDGYRLDLVVRDNASDRQTGVAMLEDLAVNERVPAIIGPLSTRVMLGMVETARKHKVVLLSPTVTNPAIGGGDDWSFRLLFDDRFQGVALARFILGELKLQRAAAVINDRHAYSASMFGAFRQVFEAGGGRILLEEHYDWIASAERPYDFVPMLRRIKQANPDVILLPVNSAEIAAIIRQSLEVGLPGIYCGGDTWQNEAVFLESGNNLDKSYFVSSINFDSGTPAMLRWLKLFDDSHDPDAQFTSILGYDSLSLIIEALKNGRDSQSIKDGLYRLKDLGIASGIISIDRERGTEKSAYIIRIDKAKDRIDYLTTVVAEILP